MIERVCTALTRYVMLARSGNNNRVRSINHASASCSRHRDLFNYRYLTNRYVRVNNENEIRIVDGLLRARDFAQFLPMKFKLDFNIPLHAEIFIGFPEYVRNEGEWKRAYVYALVAYTYERLSEF